MADKPFEKFAKEIGALQTIIDVLQPLDDTARIRVLRYIVSRFLQKKHD